MSYRVVVDSCGELSSDMKKSGHFKTASLSIEVAGHNIMDDETFVKSDFLRRVMVAKDCHFSSFAYQKQYIDLYQC